MVGCEARVSHCERKSRKTKQEKKNRETGKPPGPARKNFELNIFRVITPYTRTRAISFLVIFHSARKKMTQYASHADAMRAAAMAARASVKHEDSSPDDDYASSSDSESLSPWSTEVQGLPWQNQQRKLAEQQNMMEQTLRTHARIGTEEQKPEEEQQPSRGIETQEAEAPDDTSKLIRGKDKKKKHKKYQNGNAPLAPMHRSPLNKRAKRMRANVSSTWPSTSI